MRRWLLVPLVLTTACTLGTDPNDGGQIGEESGSRCEAVGHTPLAFEEVGHYLAVHVQHPQGQGLGSNTA